ncbi:beta-lactamase [Penicillium chermesinum]|nr:beta-lactamase [Penicillium chermesinum]
MTEIHGSCDPAFESVRGLLQQQLAQGNEVGASLCVNIDGQNVVDLWGGHADAEKSKPWEKKHSHWDLLFYKGRPILPGCQHGTGGITPEEMQDVQKSTARLAQQAPWFPAGSQSAYQTSTYGHLVGELVRRISGKSLTQFIADEIADPLGADFHLGISEEDWPRTADIVPFPAEYAAAFNFDPESFLGKSAAGSALLPLLPNDPKFRKAENGSWGGFSNARALARIGSIVSLDGTVDGKKYLSPETLDAVMKEQIQGNDPILFVYMRYALGFGLPPGKDFRSVPEGDGICFWGGWGGSLLVMDRRRRMTIAYMMNKMEFRTIGCARAEEYVQDIYKNFDAKK